MFLDVAPAAAGVKPPPASPKPDPAILGRRGGTAEDAERKPHFPLQPLHAPPAFPEKPAQAEIVLRQVSHDAFGHLADDHVRPRPLDVTPIEIVRPYELALAVSASMAVKDSTPCEEKESPKIKIFLSATAGFLFLKAT